MNPEIAIVRQHRDMDPFEREVEGLIEICKYLSSASAPERAAINFLKFDEHVVKEARRRILGKS